MELVSTFTGAPDLFSNADGIGLDQEGDLYVADAGNSRIQKLDGEGHLLRKWGSQGSKDGQFTCAPVCGLAVDGDGNVYVTDSGNQRVQKFDKNGKFLAKWGSRGIGAGQFSEELADIATDAAGNVYVTDRQNGLQVFDRDMQFVAKWDDCGDDRPLTEATGVALDTGGQHLCE